ncbi:MAG: ATP-binding protein [Acidimicrobiia bacterium]
MGSDAPWPIAGALARENLRIAAEPAAPVETITRDLWPEPVGQALTLALAASAPNERPHGVIVVVLNPRVPLDRAYMGYAEHVAREIATGLDRVCRLAQERQAALAAAHAERKLLEDVFDLSPAFLAVVRGPEHVFELANAAYYRLIGQRPGIGQKVVDALPELAGQGFVELLDGVSRTGEPFVGNELPIQLQVVPGGALEERHVNFVYQPMRDANGLVTGVLVSGVDVTALVHAREAAEGARLDAERLAAERDIDRRRLLTVLEQSPLGIVIAEAPSGRFLFLNAKVGELFGDSLISGATGDYSANYRGFHPDGRVVQPQEWPLSRALQGEMVWNEVIEIERIKTGQRFQISINAAPVRDAEGGITAGVAMFWDVTEERRAERQLRDVQRIQAVGTLAGGVAHEINNQMTSVMGFGGFVLRALGPDHPQASDVRRILQAGERAARVSQQLLAFTRQQVTQPRLLDLLEVVTELAPVLQQLLGSDKNLSVVGSRSLQVNADPDQVQQVLINLVANARDATETGADVQITVEEIVLETELPAPLGESVAPGRYVRLSIADNGAGMAPDTLARIFDPFFTTKAVGKGTGLGLPMVYGTMRRHGGYVVTRSAPGAGTTMELYWPVAPEGQAPAHSDPSEDPPRHYSADGAVILVAEDEPAVHALAVRTLQEEGYRVLAGADWVEALEALEAEFVRPDVVVTDVTMPRMNGRQLSDVVRARWPDVPVLFISGHTGQGDMLQRLVPPGAPFLRKPFTSEELALSVGALRTRAAISRSP